MACGALDLRGGELDLLGMRVDVAAITATEADKRYAVCLGQCHRERAWRRDGDDVGRADPRGLCDEVAARTSGEGNECASETPALEDRVTDRLVECVVATDVFSERAGVIWQRDEGGVCCAGPSETLLALHEFGYCARERGERDATSLPFTR